MCIRDRAIKRLYPQADFAFGPATDNGFFYDVDLGDTTLSDEDLANIENDVYKRQAQCPSRTGFRGTSPDRS